MEPLTEPQIRASFVNCSKGEASRLHLPRDLDATPWDDLDFLGWRDPQAPARVYLVTVHDGVRRGLQLRAPGTTGRGQQGMCSLCTTVRSGDVALLVAPRAGRAGKAGHTVGTYVCGDLACSLLVRDKVSSGGARLHETLTVEEKVARLRANLDAFVARVLRQD